ncbi:LysR family transcriptional regulator [Crossiella sp. CA198]|uniref:LysR family transcriptional regulator n=1 Tax=Crossiella sp. CA198 TaxID=3455607 RepID=UPI003F8D55BC
MDLLALRHFQTLARLEHVGRAADQLRIAQPSLSRTLTRLEQDLGVPLFDRHGRRIRLNRFGSAFLRRVDRVLAELDDARQELADAAGLARGIVAVATETLLPLTEVLRTFLARHPLVDVRLFQSAATGMADQLRTGEADLCIGSQPLPGKDIHTQVLLDEPVLLCVPTGHRLAGQGRISVAELTGEPFITTPPGYWQRTLVERLFATAGADLHVVCEGEEPEGIFHLIGAGFGIGLVPAFGRRIGLPANVVWLEVADPGCHRVLSVAWRQDSYLSVAAQRFRDHTIEQFSAVLP